MSEELNEAVSKARQKSENLTTRIKVGFHFVVIGLLLLLVTLNWNAAETTRAVYQQRQPTARFTKNAEFSVELNPTIKIA